MLQYCLTIEVDNKKVTRVYGVYGNTGAIALNSYIDYLIDEGFESSQIKDPLIALISTTGESEHEICRRLNDSERNIGELINKGIYLGLSPENLDELSYVNLGEDEPKVEDLESVLILLKAALDALNDISSLGGSVEIIDNKISIIYDEKNNFNKSIFDRIKSIIESKHSVVYSLQSFMFISRVKKMKRYVIAT